MKRTFTLILIVSLLLSAITAMASCAKDPLDEFLDKLNDTRKYSMEVKNFGFHGVSTIASVYDENKILSTGISGEISYLEKAEDGYYVYYKNPQNDWVKQEYEGSTDKIYLDSIYLDFKNYIKADEEPNTYKFKSQIEIEGVVVEEVRASLRDGKFVITVPSETENGATTQITIHNVGLAKVSLPEVK